MVPAEEVRGLPEEGVAGVVQCGEGEGRGGESHLIHYTTAVLDQWIFNFGPNFDFLDRRGARTTATFFHSFLLSISLHPVYHQSSVSRYLLRKSFPVILYLVPPFLSIVLCFYIWLMCSVLPSSFSWWLGLVVGCVLGFLVRSGSE